jgi:hypothetical protein
MAHEDESEIARLKRQQRDQEHAEREQLAESETDSDAERHVRRADKAHYLRQKLEEQERADREATGHDGKDPG